MFHGSGKNVQILHKQARTDQNAISELSRTPLLKQTGTVQCTIRDLTEQIPRFSTHIVYQLHSSNFLTLIGPSQDTDYAKL